MHPTAKNLHQVAPTSVSFSGRTSWMDCLNIRMIFGFFNCLQKWIYVLAHFACRHGDPIQCLTFNPVSHQLASCTQSDFAFWSTDQKAVQKYKVSSKINCCAWTNDGQYLALGLSNGTVSIRNKVWPHWLWNRICTWQARYYLKITVFFHTKKKQAGDEKGKIERPGPVVSPIYGITWNPINSNNADIICIADWNQTISFYTLGGQIVGKERQLGFDPLSVTCFPDSDFIVVSGCNKAIQLFTKDGIRLGTLGDPMNSWIWTTAIHPSGTSMVRWQAEPLRNAAVLMYVLCSICVYL